MARFWTDRSTKDRLPPVVLVLGLGIVLLGTTEFMIAGLLPAMAADLHESIPHTGLLISGFAIGMLVGAPVMAVVTLRLPRRTTLAAALVVFAAGHVVTALASGFAIAFVARVATAVATGTYWAVAAVVVTSVAGPGRQARGLAVLIGGLTVANVAGVPLGTLVGDHLGWRAPFWILAAASVAMAFVLVPMVPHADPDAPAPQVRAELTAFRSGRLWLTLATIVLLESGVFGFFSYLSPLLTARAGLSAGLVPMALAVFGVGAFIGARIGGRLGDSYPWRLMAGGLAAATATLVAVALLGGHIVPTVVLVGLLGIAGFTTAAPLTARVITLAGPAPTLASATSTSAFNVGNAVGPWLGGLALAHAGTAAPPVVGAVFVAAALAMTGVAVLADRRFRSTAEVVSQQARTHAQSGSAV